MDIILTDKSNCSNVSVFPNYRVNFRHICFISSPQSRSANLKVSSAPKGAATRRMVDHGQFFFAVWAFVFDLDEQRCSV